MFVPLLLTVIAGLFIMLGAAFVFFIERYFICTIFNWYGFWCYDNVSII